MGVLTIACNSSQESKMSKWILKTVLKKHVFFSSSRLWGQFLHQRSDSATYWWTWGDCSQREADERNRAFCHDCFLSSMFYCRPVRSTKKCLYKLMWRVQEGTTGLEMTRHVQRTYRDSLKALFEILLGSVQSQIVLVLNVSHIILYMLCYFVWRDSVVGSSFILTLMFSVFAS